MNWLDCSTRTEKSCCCYIVVLSKIAFYGVETSLEIAVLINELSEYENWNFFTSKIYPDTLKQSAISCQSIASTANIPNKVLTMHNLNYESEKKIRLHIVYLFDTARKNGQPLPHCQSQWMESVQNGSNIMSETTQPGNYVKMYQNLCKIS